MEIYGVPRSHTPILKIPDRRHFVRNCKKHNNKETTVVIMKTKKKAIDGKQVPSPPPPGLSIVSCITINRRASNKSSNVYKPVLISLLRVLLFRLCLIFGGRQSQTPLLETDRSKPWMVCDAFQCFVLV